MQALDEMRDQICSEILAAFSRDFFLEMQKRAELAYPDVFEQVRLEPALLDEHRIHKLRQDRCFRMDYELTKAAEKFGLPSTSKALAENDWQFTYVTSGSFGFTQSTVQDLKGLPNPAKFRESLANAAKIPRLHLDTDPEIFLPKRFYGLFTHNPVGQKFDAESQKLGALQFSVPYEGMKGWAFHKTVVELLSLYPAEPKKAVATRQPMWKETAKRGTGES